MQQPLIIQASRYVGRPYAAGEFDCADLAVLVQRELFGRPVALPAHHPGGARTQGALILRLRDALAVEVAEPVDGCAVLLWEPDGDVAPTLPTACGSLPPEGADSPWGGPAANRRGEDLRRWHIGTVFLHAGEVWVLHASAKMGSVALQRLADLRRWGLRLEGFYAWRAGA